MRHALPGLPPENRQTSGESLTGCTGREKLVSGFANKSIGLTRIVDGIVNHLVACVAATGHREASPIDVAELGLDTYPASRH